MADGGNANKTEARVYDPRTDANWQARLEEARAKRELVLSKRPRPKHPRKRFKPWEEEGAVVLDDEGDFNPGETGLDFSSRVDAMRASARPQKSEPDTASAMRDTEQVMRDSGPAMRAPEPLAREPEPVVGDPEPVVRAPAPELRGAEPVVRDAEAEFRARTGWDPEATHPGAEAASLRLRTVSRPPVNKVAYDASQPRGFDSRSMDDPFDTSADVLPIEAVRVPLAEAPATKRQWRAPPAAKVEPQVDLTALRPVKTTDRIRKIRVPGKLVVALVFASAIAVGPVYQMLRPVERGPLVYTLSAFPTEPPLGLTSPMFEMPLPDRGNLWHTRATRPSSSPLELERPNVPNPTRRLPGLFEAPAESELALDRAPVAVVVDNPMLRRSRTLPSVVDDRGFAPDPGPGES